MARTPSVAGSWSHRLERPIPPGARAPFPSPPQALQPIADLLSRGPRPLDLLSQAAWPEGPPLAFPREEERDPRSPRCLPSVRSTSDRGDGPRPVDQAKHTTTLEGGPLSTGCSQAVDKSPPFSSCDVLRSDGAETGKELDAGGRSVRKPMRLTGARSALRTSAFRSIRGSKIGRAHV